MKACDALSVPILAQFVAQAWCFFETGSMSDAEEFFCPPPVAEDPAADDAEEFFAPAPDAVPLAHAGGRHGRPRQPPTSGFFGAWLVSEVAPSGTSASSSSVEYVPVVPRRVVIGLARCQWEWRPSVLEESPTVARGPGGQHSQGAVFAGYIEYSFHDFWRFRRDVPVDPSLDLSSLSPPLLLGTLCRDVCLQDPDITHHDLENVTNLVFDRVFERPLREWDDYMAAGCPLLYRTVPVEQRMLWDELVFDYPTRGAVGRWRKESGINSRKRRPTLGEEAPEADPHARHLLQMPAPKRRRDDRGERDDAGARPNATRPRLDPMKLVDAISFSLKLRSVHEFTDALDDAHRFNYAGDDGPPKRDSSSDPSRGVIDRGKAHADAVGMLLERRIFADEMASDSIEAINCYTDASPVVGAELQGMIVDFVHRDRSVRKTTLPGSTLHYGHCDAVNKSVSFMYAVWLVCGPEEDKMTYVFSKCRSFTTDFGTEMHGTEIPWLLTAFLAWLDGRKIENCRDLIDFSRRQFYRVLRIAGWNHLCGNVMKRIAAVAPSWPHILEQVSALCQFYRNETWRTHLVVRLSSKIPGLEALLKSFTAGVAKWRFETIVETFRQLLLLRRLSQEFVREELFANIQDRNLLQAVVNACRDPFLWSFIACSYNNVFQSVEGVRHWGMVCPCCKDKRDQGGKHIQCQRNSRRLKEVPKFIADEVARLRQLAKDLTPEQCDGNQVMRSLIQAMLRTTADLFQKRTKYFTLVPWLFVQADSIEGAAACVAQVKERPLADHDPTTCDIWSRLQSDLELRAAGGDLTPALAEEVRCLEHTPLDEACGEGYHRDTTHEKVRAPSASMAHLKRNTRIKGVVKLIRTFCRENGHQGREIVRYEFRTWQRVLQTKKRYLWRPKRMKPKDVYKRLYREDAKCDEDWSSIATRLPHGRPIPPENATNREQLEREYLTAVFKPLEFYSVDNDVESLTENGVRTVKKETRYFQLLAAQTGNRKERLMHTFKSAEDETLRAGLALHVVFHERWQHPDADDDGQVRVYPEGDDEWVLPQRIAPYVALSENMLRWHQVAQDPDNLGCVVLSEPKLARPRFALEDERCPTLSLVKHLRDQGWTSVSGYVEHTTIPIEGAGGGDFDSREACRMKFYYRAVIELSKTLPLTGYRMPSQQPVSYYRLLLRGMKAEPDLSAKHYVLQYNRSVKLKDADKNTLLPLPPPKQKQLEDEMFVRPPGSADPNVGRGRRGGPGIRGRGRGAGSRGSGGDGGGRGGAAPPAPLPPAPPGPVVGPLQDPPPVMDVDEVFVPPVPVPDRTQKRKKQEDQPWKDGLDGCKILFTPYVTPLGVPQPNWQLKCPYHESCFKRRGALPQFQREFGEVEPLMFLHAWSHVAWPTKPGVPTHARENPTDDAVRAYGLAHLEELKKVMAEALE